MLKLGGGGVSGSDFCHLDLSSHLFFLEWAQEPDIGISLLLDLDLKLEL